MAYGAMKACHVLWTWKGCLHVHTDYDTYKMYLAGYYDIYMLYAIATITILPEVGHHSRKKAKKFIKGLHWCPVLICACVSRLKYGNTV